MKRVLISGAAGFIGANLARRMLREGHAVGLLLNSEPVSWRLREIQNDVRMVRHDLRDAEGLKSIVSEIAPDWIFHLAAHGAYSYQTDVQRITQTNYQGTVNLLEACLLRDFEAFIHTGTSSEYGFKDHAPAENEWIEPNSFYAVSKAAATLHCRYVAISRNLPIRTVRLYSAFGPFEEPTRLIPNLIVHGLAGGYPPLVNPDIARDFVYAEDINDALIAAASVPGQVPGAIYNAGTGIQTSLGEAVDVCRQLLNISAQPVWGSMPDRHWDTKIWVANNAEIQKALGWTPRHNFAEGIESMIKWFGDNPEMLRHYLALQTSS